MYVLVIEFTSMETAQSNQASLRNTVVGVENVLVDSQWLVSNHCCSTRPKAFNVYTF